ncbi:spore germination protein [Caloranaerobacter ferrireducens]|uniref:spore germination protein n=1 Tax=Caloranaerobacter ferrireducens TaxID=1323370 RepID=UPI000A40D0CC|nr:spore germination protein [Caloranaerobacter ferrireducens]
MLRYFTRLLNYFVLKAKNDSAQDSQYYTKTEKIPRSIESVKAKLKEIFSDSSDFVLREIVMGENSEVKILVAFIDGLTNKQTVNTNILKALMIESRISNLNRVVNKETIIDILKENLLSIGDLKIISDFKQTVDDILSGDTVIYIDGKTVAFKADTKGWESRGVEEPDTEAVVRGPREGFTETLRTNTALLRRKIRNPKLKFEMIKLGEQTNTEVCICYIKGIANPDIIETVKRRLEKIKIDAILESGYIEEFIEDEPFSLFPTVGNSEKPDVVAAKLLEGRIAILCDGTPFALTVPYLLIETIQASEDYYSRPYFASIARFARVLAFLGSVILPSFYVALISFHADVIPFKLLLSVSASREGLPTSAFTEALLMVLSFELLREAGVRMPRPIGQAVSIVGALVLGEAAVKAGLVSNLMIMVTALTAISSFVVPPMGGTIPILRVLFLIPANTLGFMGLFLSIFVVLIHLCSLRSFGVPYTSPFAPLDGMGLKDSIVRFPIWSMITRPKAITGNKNRRIEYRMKVNHIKKED